MISAPEAVLGELRRARRRRRIEALDAFETLYRVYITAIVVGMAVWLLSGITGDQRLGPAAVAAVAAHAPQVVGMAIGLAWAIGARSGGRGGPLVIEAADVRHVLLAPIARSVALRSPAVRQLRFAALVGAGAGALGGLLAYRRMPGAVVAWLAGAAGAGILAALGAMGLAMLVAGRQGGRWVGGGLALGVTAWSAADLATAHVTSPATYLGELGASALRWRPGAVIGVVVALALAGAGFASVGGSSIEAAERRATLVGQIRFAATLRDLRTVVVLRRQLSQELPRQRPWARLPRRGRLAGWRRGWHGILRFPALRFARLAVLGAAAGAAGVGAWRGTTPLVVGAGVTLYVAGLDAVEPLAQELDHPDRRDSYPVASGEAYLRLLGPSVVLMVGVALVGMGVAVAVSGGSLLAAEIGAVMVLPAAACGLAGATVSVIQGPPPTFSTTDSLMPPEAAGARAVTRMLWPPLVATAGVLPLLAGRHPGPGRSAAALVASVEIPVVVLVVLAGAWVRNRERIHAWWRDAMEEAKGARGRPAG